MELSDDILLACEVGDLVSVTKALDGGADPNADHGDWPALHRSIASGNNDVVRLLLSRGASPNLRASDGAKPMIDAAECNNVEAIRIVLSFGAHLDDRDDFGHTALMRALVHDRREAALALLDLGASTTAVDAAGVDAEGLARMFSGTELAVAIREHAHRSK